MWGLGEEILKAEKLIDSDPRAALNIIKTKRDKIDKELVIIHELGREFSEMAEDLGHANFVLKDKGKSFGKSYSDTDIDSVIQHDLNEVVKRFNTAKPLFDQLVANMKKLEQ